MNSRKMRLPEIIDILTHKSVSSQEELSKQLAVRGFIVTQATLSRDLKMLKANKVSDDRGVYRYVVADGKSYGRRSRRGTAMVCCSSCGLPLPCLPCGWMVLRNLPCGAVS